MLLQRTDSLWSSFSISKSSLKLKIFTSSSNEMIKANGTDKSILFMLRITLIIFVICLYIQ